MKKNETNKNIAIDLLAGKEAQAFYSMNHLFTQYVCPHCKSHNVINNTLKKESIVCSNSVCRKIVILQYSRDEAS